MSLLPKNWALTMRGLFTIDDSFHGRGSVLFSWQPDGNFLATAGGNGLVHIFDRHGAQVRGGTLPFCTRRPSPWPAPWPASLHLQTSHTRHDVRLLLRMRTRSLALLALRSIASSLARNASTALLPPLRFHRFPPLHRSATTASIAPFVRRAACSPSPRVTSHHLQVDEIHLTSGQPVLMLDWDKDGETLAVLQKGNGTVPLWDTTSRGVTNLETNLKAPTFLKWSQSGPQLAIGTGKGNLLLYRKDNRKKIPVLGKHSKKITCGAWSADNRLALGAEDKTMTLSTADGDTIEMTELKYEPMEIQFATQKTSEVRRFRDQGGQDTESTVSINMGGRTALLYNLNNPDNPVELAFQQRYGSIVAYRWFGDGYMMIGFSEG